jgi:predicted phage tail protein
MVNVRLEGVLSKDFKSFWELRVLSVFEIFEAIAANNPDFVEHLINLNSFFTHFAVIVDGKIIPYYHIKSKILKKNSKVRIVPILQGAWTTIIIGVLLIVLSIVLMSILSPKSPKDIKTNSFALGSIQNVEKRNVPIPIGYGRLRVGSLVISNLISSKNISVDAEQTDDTIRQTINGIVYTLVGYDENGDPIWTTPVVTPTVTTS